MASPEQRPAGTMEQAATTMGVSENDLDFSCISQAEQQQAKEEEEGIAARESRWVFSLRILVLVVLVLSAVAVVVTVYLFLTNTEQADFEAKFDRDANKVVEAVGRTLDQTMGSSDAFVVDLVNYARTSDSTWPFVTMPGFALKAGKLRKIAKAFFLVVRPFVQPEQRTEWESYTAFNTKWMIEESRDIQAHDEDVNPGISAVNVTIGPINVGKERGVAPGLWPNRTNYTVGWQQYPIVTGSHFNGDLWGLPFVAKACDDAIQHQRATIVPPNTRVSFTKRFMAANSDEDPSEPFSSMEFPIYDSTESITLDVTQPQPLVGIFHFAFFWRDYIRNILPEGSNGILVVFSTPCSEPFTYRLDGPTTTYLGPGDLHDPKYNHMGKSQTLFETMEITKQSNAGSSYTGIPLSETYCPPSILVYPSQAMQDDHVTSSPTYYALVAACIFLFTSLVFVVYDCVVARRQRIVKEQAVAAGAIVNNLFPKKVLTQMYQEQKEEKQNLKAFLKNDLESNNPQARQSIGTSKPMADLFHDTTIFFADLAGFTAWSSKRTPVEVFELLEALYGAFDSIAAKRQVFKVETIGDCYVAVTGIPEPQKRHATIMVRFATDAMSVMNQITHQLAESLGPDTTNLEMRVGLHSGSTTAGVLRGDKGRFQLFGDTVNTASRMESNGVKGRIHVSQATADALREAGKASWLTPREDKIVAKGKGEMQTYFVQIGTGSSNGQSNDDTSVCDLLGDDDDDDDEGAVGDQAIDSVAKEATQQFMRTLTV